MIDIHGEHTSDESAIDAVHRAAFAGPDEAELVRLLRESGNSRLSLIAECRGQVIGQIFLSPVNF